MSDIHSRRREAFKDRLLKDAAGRPGAALFFSGEESGLQAFSPDPTFYYLTGVDVPHAALAFIMAQGKVSEALFLPESDPAAERWTVKSLAAGNLTPEVEPDETRAAAAKTTGIGSISPYHQIEGALQRPMREAELLYLDFPGDGSAGGPPQLFAERMRGRYPYLEIRHGGRLAADLRRVKDREEVRLMREAMAVTAEAHRAVLRHLRPGLSEREVQAIVEYVFTSQGAQALAFPSIVGSGPYSCILHYEKNARTMRAGDLVVVDIGCRKDLYCADVTRTYPVSGRFTKRQARVYDAVLEAQAAAVAAVKPGVLVRDVHQAAVESIAKAGFGKYFFHGTSHYLGLEAHDVGSYEKTLEPGVVITVEPGVYIAHEAIGVRIEDDVLVTAKGAEVLTKPPRDRASIEKALAAKRRTIVI